mmetsp:Transcript_24656/g.85081  ORF Transcript_24656/g.85081 Transcript_24656/m.85081 type:complete len:1159 (-) Transcript_24656:103-3579(-)
MYVATASAVVPAYNLEALAKVGASLVLDRETLPMIFLGDIFEWTDPRILDLQNSQTRGLLLKMPDVTIRVVVRDDGSGTTEIFTNALSAFSGDFSTRLGGHDVQDWCEDGMEELECPGGVYTDGTCDSNPSKKNCFGGEGECEGISWVFDSGFATSGTVTCQKPVHQGRQWSYTRENGSVGAVAAVLSLPGSIGYFGVADANQALLVQALLINKAGFPVLANGDSVDFTLLELGGFLDERGIGNLIDASGFRAYPIVGFTYFVVRKGFHDGVNYMDNAAEMFDCGTRLKTLAFLEWFYTSDTLSGLSNKLGFTNLPTFLSSSIVDDLVTDNFCLENGQPRQIKKRFQKQEQTLFAIEPAFRSMLLVTAVYELVDEKVVWNVEVASNDFAVNRNDRGLGVAAIFGENGQPLLKEGQTDEGVLKPGFFAAPFSAAGVAAMYHVGSLSDLSLTHQELADIYTCKTLTWKQLRSDLPDEKIGLVVRSDETNYDDAPSPSNVNDVFTASLVIHVEGFDDVIGRTRVLNSTYLTQLGCLVVGDVFSDPQVEASINFHDFSLGMWTLGSVPSANLAGFRSSPNSQPFHLNRESLRACVNNDEQQVRFASQTFGFQSLVYDLSFGSGAGCWPYARSYAMTIAEDLLGPSQCESEGGPSQALQLMRWIYSERVFDSIEASFFDSPSMADRQRVLDILDEWPLNRCDPSSSGVKSGLLILVASVGAALLILCAVGGCLYMRLQRRRLKAMLDRAQVRLPSNVDEILQEVFERVQPDDGGKVADYIPELASADPTPFAIVLSDLKGNLHTAGDSSKRFTLQSACKPLLYCLALEDNGMEAVDKKVGSEPTGGPFNVVSFDTQGRPFNPYVNAGAICTAGLVAGASAEERFRRTMSLFNSMSLGAAQCGTSLDVAVYDSEMATNGNNQIIVQEALKRGLIPSGQGQVALDAYTMACSLSVDCREVACVAATLANNGVNPQTGEEVMPAWVVNRTVSTMMTCGMYNGAGAWMVEVGIPAKSGVSGVIMCVVPGVCGFAAFSPRLDANGNSTRGVAVAREMSEKLGLHVLHQKAPVVPKFVDNGSKVDFSLDRITGRKRTPDNSRERVVARKHGSTPDNSQERVVARRDVPGASPMHALQRGRSARIEPSANYAGNAPADECRLAERIAEEP